MIRTAATGIPRAMKHKMDAGKVVPVVVLCCGEDACKGSNYKFEVKDWATGVAAYAHCKEKNACTDAKFEVKEGHSLHVKCGGPASKKTCENAKVEVKGSGVATCSGNGCSNLASGYPKRRLDAAAAPAGDWCAARCPACAVVDGGNGFDFGDASSCVCFDGAVPDGTEVTLTPYDDCARVSGNELYVYADDGDDIVEAVGDYIYLDGGWGDDTLAASGGYNYVVGQGGVDTCFNGGEGGCTCEIKDCGDEDEPSAAVAP